MSHAFYPSMINSLWVKRYSDLLCRRQFSHLRHINRFPRGVFAKNSRHFTGAWTPASTSFPQHSRLPALSPKRLTIWTFAQWGHSAAHITCPSPTNMRTSYFTYTATGIKPLDQPPTKGRPYKGHKSKVIWACVQWLNASCQVPC